MKHQCRSCLHDMGRYCAQSVAGRRDVRAWFCGQPLDGQDTLGRPWLLSDADGCPGWEPASPPGDDPEP